MFHGYSNPGWYSDTAQKSCTIPMSPHSFNIGQVDSPLYKIVQWICKGSWDIVASGKAKP